MEGLVPDVTRILDRSSGVRGRPGPSVLPWGVTEVLVAWRRTVLPKRFDGRSTGGKGDDDLCECFLISRMSRDSRWSRRRVLPFADDGLGEGGSAFAPVPTETLRLLSTSERRVLSVFTFFPCLYVSATLPKGLEVQFLGVEMFRFPPSYLPHHLPLRLSLSSLMPHSVEVPGRWLVSRREQSRTLVCHTQDRVRALRVTFGVSRYWSSFYKGTGVTVIDKVHWCG